MFDLTGEEARLLLNVAMMATGQNRFRSAAKILAALERFRPEEASVAVANATPAAAAAARYHIGRCDEDSVAAALEEIACATREGRTPRFML